MSQSGLSMYGRFATKLATWLAPTYKARVYLSRLSPKGYIAPSANIHHNDIKLGKNVFIGDRVIIYKSDSGSVELCDDVKLYSDIIIETGFGGSLTIGKNTHIQPRCQLNAYKGSIKIGQRVEIAPNCAFYPYNHGIVHGEPIRMQPAVTKGGIIVGDDSWLGYGVIVLDGVQIGNGAVVGAGAVVTHDIPDGAIAAGVPARILKQRSDIVSYPAGEGRMLFSFIK